MNKARLIKISTFPYGRITKRLRRSVQWLNRSMNKISKSEEYPDYWNLPRSLSDYLTPDEVDWIQEETYEWHSRN